LRAPVTDIDCRWRRESPRCSAERGVDSGGRRRDNAGHMKEINTPTATLLLT